jgi:NNP family nitrate/nitrite transporter-like MFS transporter
MSDRKKAKLILTISTLAFSFCFASWVLNAVLATWLVSQGVFDFSDSQMGWLLALPILTGALSRVPLGLMTDRYGGHRVFLLLLVAVAGGMVYLSRANNYQEFVIASLLFGLAGGSFSVGISYVSDWFPKQYQGTALGIFGMGNAGAALTTLLAPALLNLLTDNNSNLDAWRYLPLLYAGLLIVIAVIFWFKTENYAKEPTPPLSIRQQLAPLGNIIVWRFGLYYFLVFGAFVSLAQWIIPYSVSVYGLTLVQAGLIATLFSLPSGIIRALGGWMSDKFGARRVMYWVFGSTLFACLLLSIPRMEINSPGQGMLAKASGTVTDVSVSQIKINDRIYSLSPAPEKLPAKADTENSLFFPTAIQWQQATVVVGDQVLKKQLIATGHSNIYYPANLWVFILLLLMIGISTGIGKAAVYKFIPDHFPNSVGAVGGMVGLIGALGGFVFPPVWGYLLESTGLWTMTWVVLSIVTLICLLWMHRTVTQMMNEQAPDLANLMELRPELPLNNSINLSGKQAKTLEQVLSSVPFFAEMKPEAIKSLARLGNIEPFPSGHLIFEEGSQGDSFYVILQGNVSIQKQKDNHQRIEVAQLNAGEFFGEMALIDRQSRSASVVTQSNCEVFVLHRKDFFNMLSRSPHMVADVLLSFSVRMRGLLDNYSQQQQKPLKTPVAN